MTGSPRLFVLTLFLLTLPLAAKAQYRFSDELPSPMPAFRAVSDSGTSGPTASGPAAPLEYVHAYPPGQANIDWGRFSVSAGALGAGIFALHVYQLNAWWAGQRGRFHVYDDPDYKVGYDKLGHAFGAYYSAHFFEEGFSWGGFDSAQSVALASTCALLWELYIEVEDGFARDWGFSPGDAYADLTGATFFFLRNRVPVLRNFQYKWSYFPSDQLLENRPDIPGQTLNFIEDYGGQFYWLSANVHGLLPQSLKPYWPEWLQIAVGGAGWKLDSRNQEDKRIALMLSLDYDLEKLIPESEIGILNFLRRSFNYWHLPAPAVRLYPEPRFYVLFPFRMSIG